MTTFSVVTPTRNGGDALRRCVGSVRGQVGVQVEHFVEDAESTDGTLDWLRVQSDIVVHSGKDGGMYFALNNGLARTRGDVISWLNADEQYLPGTLRAVADVFESDPSAMFLCGNTILTDPDGRPLAARRDIPLRHPYMLYGVGYGLSCAMFFRRQLYEEGLLHFDTRYRLAADVDMFHRLLVHGHKCAHVDRYLSLFGVDGGNQSNSAISIPELRAVQRKYGARESKLFGCAVLLGRTARKVVTGCYRPVSVAYRYAIDEVPHYREVAQTGVGWKWTFGTTA